MIEEGHQRAVFDERAAPLETIATARLPAVPHSLENLLSPPSRLAGAVHCAYVFSEMPLPRMRRRFDTRVLRGVREIGILLACQAVGCTLWKPRLERILLEPAAANVAVGGRQEFTVVGRMSDGSRVSIPVTYTATGGTVTPQGAYSAGNEIGVYRVIASAVGRSLADTAEIVVTPETAHNYTTTFPLAEHPISESGRWINGGTVGRDWTDVSTTPGLAIGHQVGVQYTDGTAILGGEWGPDQRATARAFTMNEKDECFQEVEIRLRSTVSASHSTGYEISYKASQSNAAYMGIVRWNGPVGDFTILTTVEGPKSGVRSGDVVAANVIGNVITAYRNGVTMATARDDTYASGGPGMGFNLVNKNAGCPGTNGDYGFTSFTASDFRPAANRPALARD